MGSFYKTRSRDTRHPLACIRGPASCARNGGSGGGDPSPREAAKSPSWRRVLSAAHSNSSKSSSLSRRSRSIVASDARHSDGRSRELPPGAAFLMSKFGHGTAPSRRCSATELELWWWGGGVVPKQLSPRVPRDGGGGGAKMGG